MSQSTSTSTNVKPRKRQAKKNPMMEGLQKLESELEEERSANRKLQVALNALQDINATRHEEQEALKQKCLALEKANTEFERQLERQAHAGNEEHGEDVRPIPRPKGSAGNDWSIQQEMGLSGSAKKTEIYKGLQRVLRDLVLNARLKWDSAWSDIPAADKTKLFQVARDQHPFLKRFVNDWATEEIVKQYMKNKRKNHYKNGWLPVPEKYKYLKQNSRKRNPQGSRMKRAKSDSSMALSTKAQGKGKADVPEETDDEDDEDDEDDGDDGHDGDHHD